MIKNVESKRKLRLSLHLPPQLRLSATSNGEQRVRVRVPDAQGLNSTIQFLMQEYQIFVNWTRKGLELPSTEKRYKASVKKFERSPTVLAEWIELKKLRVSRSSKLREAMKCQTTRGPII